MQASTRRRYPPAFAICVLASTVLAQPAIAQCHVGPVSFPAPTCDVTTKRDDDRQDYVDWEDSGTSYEIVLITPRRRQGYPGAFRGYLARWQHNHKCTVAERQVGKLIQVSTVGPDVKEIPPQLTWTGTCAAGDIYFIRAFVIGKQIVEVHASVSVGRSGAPLERSFSTLLDQLVVSPRR
jgi:hypothetical protein